MRKRMAMLAIFIVTLTYAEMNSLSIGGNKLNQTTKTEKNIVEGMTYYKIMRGEANKNENIAIISTILDEKSAEDAKEKLTKAGIKNVEIVDLPEKSPHGKSLGKMITIDFTNESEAKAALPKIKESYDNNFTIRNKAENGYLTEGPYDISILEVDFNKYKGNVKSALANNEIIGLDTTTNIAKENEAIAAINGGYFVFNEDIGTTGDLAGISVIDGKLVSEARNGSPALLINNKDGKNSADILENVTTEIELKIGNKNIPVDGINRKLGLSFGGGNVGDNPTSKAVHDMLTTDDSEIVLFNKSYGKEVEIRKGEIAYKLVDGKVAEIKKDGKISLTEGTTVIIANGKDSTELEKLLKVGTIISISTKVLSQGKEIKLEKGMYMVNGGPTLLLDGELINHRAVEGWDDSISSKGETLDAKDDVAAGMSDDRKDFYYGWVLRRHPRTAVGVTEDNKLIGVVVFGRDYKNTVGATITEMGEILKSMGAKKAINLDGGGSAMMVIENEQTGKSSDATGERPVGDVIIFTD